MNLWTPIRYREFYDVPRIFLVEREQATYLFDCRFNEIKSEYADTYEVFLMPVLDQKDLAKSWTQLSTKAQKSLGRVRVRDVEFDPTRRSEVNLGVLRKLGVQD